MNDFVRLLRQELRVKNLTSQTVYIVRAPCAWYFTSFFLHVIYYYLFLVAISGWHTCFTNMPCYWIGMVCCFFFQGYLTCYRTGYLLQKKEDPWLCNNNSCGTCSCDVSMLFHRFITLDLYPFFCPGSWRRCSLHFFVLAHNADAVPLCNKNIHNKKWLFTTFGVEFPKIETIIICHIKLPRHSLFLVYFPLSARIWFRDYSQLQVILQVLDKAERLRDREANILPAFLRLQELVGS